MPKRFREPVPSSPAKGHKIADEDFNKPLDWYCKARGWNKNGMPTTRKLTELGLEDMAKDLKESTSNEVLFTSHKSCKQSM